MDDTNKQNKVKKEEEIKREKEENEDNENEKYGDGDFEIIENPLHNKDELNKENN